MAARLPPQEVIWRRVQGIWARGSKKIVLDRTKENVRGKVLKRRTGRLLRSLSGRLERTASVVDGFSIAVGAAHGIAWEKGFTIAPRTIRPKGSVLKFIGKRDGKTVFARAVHMPRMVMKARPFISKAVEDSVPEMETLLGRMGDEFFGTAFPSSTITLTLL